MWPSGTVFAWFGTATLRDASHGALAGFCGFSLLASFEAYTFRTDFEQALAHRSGMLRLEDCEFCMRPSGLSKTNPPFAWSWTSYSLAYSMANPDRRVVIVTDSETQPLTTAEIEAILSTGSAFRRSDAARHAAPSGTGRL